jgi:hypothetical protein
MLSQNRFRPLPVFERKEKPVTLDFNTVKGYYEEKPESCFDRLVYLLSFGLVQNENLGRFSFEEDVCPKGLKNIHVIHTPDGDIVVKVYERKVNFTEK